MENGQGRQMKNFSTRARTTARILVFCGVPLLVEPAIAALGEGPSFGNMNAQRRLQAAPAASAASSPAATAVSSSYTVVETTSEAGVAVREYLNDVGKVFAATWSGPVRPNLQLLLGAGPYAELVDASPRRRGPMQVSRSDLVIRSGGHMGALRGSAWVPSLVPQGVSADQLP